MRKETYLLILALSMTAGLCGHAAPPVSSAADLSAAALENLGARHRHGATFRSNTSRNSQKGVKLPEAASVMCSGLQNFVGEKVKTCITSSTKGGDWEMIVIDLNGNKDLTDDKAIALPGPDAVEKLVIERDGRSYAFTATMQHDRYSARLTLSPEDFLSGTATLAGEGSVPWAACDCNLNGALDDGDMVYLDRKGKRDGAIENLMRLGPEAQLLANGKWYMVSGSDDGKLVIGPYEGAMSTWTIDHSGILEDKDATHTISFRGSENRATLMDANPGAGLAAPARAWRRIYGDIKAESKTITYRIARLDLSKDAVLKLERPVANLALKQRGDKITVDLQITAPNEVRYVLERTEPGPIIEVFSEESPGEALSKGNMEYG